jgi:hypothetical protein
MSGYQGVLPVCGVKVIAKGCFADIGGHMPTNNVTNGKEGQEQMKRRTSNEGVMGNSFVLKELLLYWHTMSYNVVYLSQLRELWKIEASDRSSPYREAYRLALRQTLE